MSDATSEAMSVTPERVAWVVESVLFSASVASETADGARPYDEVFARRVAARVVQILFSTRGHPGDLDRAVNR